MMRKYFFLILMIAVSLQMFADDKVTLRASAPEVVVNGDQFRLTYTVNSQDVKDFLAPQAKGFDVLMGQAVRSRVAHRLLTVRFLPAVPSLILIF